MKCGSSRYCFTFKSDIKVDFKTSLLWCGNSAEFQARAVKPTSKLDKVGAAILGGTSKCGFNSSYPPIPTDIELPSFP
jgi:hypothetical protein